MQAINWVVEKEKWPHWSGIDFLLRSRRPFIDMLIALDLFDSHCSLTEGNLGEPIVKLTPLGWTSIDPFHDYSGYEVNQMSFFPCEERQLDALIKQMWDIEEPQSRILVRPQDEEAEETVSATLKQTTDG